MKYKLAFAICLILGVLVSYLSIADIKKGKRSLNWSKTEGTIIESKVEQRFEQQSDTKQAEYAYFPRINYEYISNGVTYRSSRLSFKPTTWRSRDHWAEAHEISNKYPEGSSAAVYYDPANPRDAVLEQGSDKASYLFPIIGAGLAVIGMLGMIFYKTRYERTEQR